MLFGVFGTLFALCALVPIPGNTTSRFSMWHLGFGLPGKEEEVDVYFYYALWAFGGDILKADGTSGLDSPEAIEAAKFYAAQVVSLVPAKAEALASDDTSAIDMDIASF